MVSLLGPVPEPWFGRARVGVDLQPGWVDPSECPRSPSPGQSACFQGPCPPGRCSREGPGELGQQPRCDSLGRNAAFLTLSQASAPPGQTGLPVCE